MVNLVSWNINGVRAAVRNGLIDFLNTYNPDILCLQEIKADESKVPKELFDLGYSLFINPADKKGYSGTLVMSKSKPESFYKGFRLININDNEGRVETLDYGKFYLVNVYFPNSQPMLTRLDYKLDFDNNLLSYLDFLRKSKGVIVCGDFNVAHEEIDIAQPKNNINHAGFTDGERKWMDKLLSNGYIDTFRYMNKDLVKYSWWSNFAKAREKNIGWRIDYFVVNDELKSKIKKADILDSVKGSDHAPIVLDISL